MLGFATDDGSVKRDHEGADHHRPYRGQGVAGGTQLSSLIEARALLSASVQFEGFGAHRFSAAH
jgi:hypothetical protein